MDSEKPTPKDQKAQEDSENREEIGGFGKKGNNLLEPTRFGDWEVNGRCSDF